jgi:hypothetical protein
MSFLLTLETLSDARLAATIDNAGHGALIVGVVEMRSELLLLVEDVIDLCDELAAPNGETGDLIAELAESADEWAMALYVDGKRIGKLVYHEVRAAFDARPSPKLIVADLQPEGGVSEQMRVALAAALSRMKQDRNDLAELGSDIRRIGKAEYELIPETLDPEYTDGVAEYDRVIALCCAALEGGAA